MVLALLAAMWAQDDCVTVTSTDVALAVRVREELRTVGLSVRDDVLCDTLITLDDVLRVVASGVAPPVVFEEPWQDGSVAVRAAHVAEVVRGVLLEVQERARAPAPAPVAPPPPEAPSPVVKPRELVALRVGGGVAAGLGGLGPSSLVEVGAALFVTPSVFVGVGLAGAPTESTRDVAEGRLGARPLLAWAAGGARFPAASWWHVAASVNVGAQWLLLRGLATAPHVGTTGSTWSATLGAELRLVVRIAGPLGVWAGVAGDWVFSAAVLDVNGVEAARYGPLVGRARGGLEVAW